MNTIFNNQYYKIYDLTSEYVCQLILSIFNKINIIEILKTNWYSTEEIKLKFNLDEQSFLPLKWMLIFLSNKNYLSMFEKEENLYFKFDKPLVIKNPEEVAEEILLVNKRILPSNRLLKSVSEEYPNFLMGNKDGLEILFSSDKINLWKDYFSNNHDGYAVHNYFGAQAVLKWLNFRENLRILELGGGIGGGTVALLELLQKQNLLGKIIKYIFSDISPIFLREGNRLIMEKIPNFENVSLVKVDFNRAINEQKIELESIDLVYGVNALHVANNLLFTLIEIKKVLKKGGILIISETVRADERSTPQPEFIFNLLDNYRKVKIDPYFRKTVGFLTPKNWKLVFENAGFKNIEIILNSDVDGDIRYVPIAMVIRGVNN